MLFGDAMSSTDVGSIIFLDSGSAAGIHSMVTAELVPKLYKFFMKKVNFIKFY